jgi:hypothetical protein
MTDNVNGIHETSLQGTFEYLDETNILFSISSFVLLSAVSFRTFQRLSISLMNCAAHRVLFLFAPS